VALASAAQWNYAAGARPVPSSKTMFLSIFGVLLISLAVLVVVAIAARLTLGD
jgi:hypothetical protein